MRKYGIAKNVSEFLFVHNGEIIFHDLKIINVVKIWEHRKMCVYELGYTVLWVVKHGGIQSLTQIYIIHYTIG